MPGAWGLALLPSPLPRKALLLPSRMGSPVPPPAPWWPRVGVDRTPTSSLPRPGWQLWARSGCQEPAGSRAYDLLFALPTAASVLECRPGAGAPSPSSL